MRVFVAGSTGVVGKNLVPLLLESGHEVVALVRTPKKGKEAEALGAKAVVADALDKDALTAAIRRAEPEVILHQLTALTGVTNFKKLDEEFALTNRLRTEATETMLAATPPRERAAIHCAELLRLAVCARRRSDQNRGGSTRPKPPCYLQEDVRGYSLPRGSGAQNHRP
jgi:nucleoside-diphosphate-sugar epimerase